MKLVVAYIEPGITERLREELLTLGVSAFSTWDATGAVPEATVTGQYRGVAIESHSRPKTRIECVVGDDSVTPVVEKMLELGGERKFAFVLAVESAFPMDTVAADAVAAPAE
jgi:nitrogen regulatory protein PII